MGEIIELMNKELTEKSCVKQKVNEESLRKNMKKIEVKWNINLKKKIVSNDGMLW